MKIENYTVIHIHSDMSLLDSATSYKDYILKAKDLGQKAICFTEHGNVYGWVSKKNYCESTQYKLTSTHDVKYFDDKFSVDKYITEQGMKDFQITELQPIKYMHGIEIYLTASIQGEPIRDNYHTILIAKNYEGVKEINRLVYISFQKNHKYYEPRITFDEFLEISDNVIKISACLGSPLYQIPKFIEHNPDSPRNEMFLRYYERLISHYDYLEVQPHVNSYEQKEYNNHLYALSKAFGKPLIAGTDTHSIDDYKAQCRKVLKYGKEVIFSNEDNFDLTYKTIDELKSMFKQQGVLPEMAYMSAINNTNILAESVQEFKLDLSFKYPVMYDDEETALREHIYKKYNEKVSVGEIQENPAYIERAEEEISVFKEIGMMGFMMFMSELCIWCRNNDIPIGPCRGSVGGSVTAYLTDITDVDPIKWNTVFARFANRDRKEIGDIDLDFAPCDREKVYNHIIEQFGTNKTAYILTIGTIKDKGTIDVIVKSMHVRYCIEHNLDFRKHKSIYNINYAEKIKNVFDENQEKAREHYPDVFKYFDGLNGTAVSHGIHPAGIVVSPIELPENYGVCCDGDKCVLSLNMDEVHEVSLVKYDILGLKNIGIIKDTCALAGIPYPKAYTMNWNDDNVWNDMLISPVGIFQFESDFAFQSLKKMKPKKINDMSMVNAVIRPGAKSFRNKLLSRQKNKNPSKLIDDLLADNNGYLIFQEDTIKFLTNICGLSGSDADNVRRAIGRKQKDRLEKAMPGILAGYCEKSDKDRATAEREAQEFLRIIEDSSKYQFGYNHSTGYSMIGYICAYLRYYYPIEFITAYLNNSETADDKAMGYALAAVKHITVESCKFQHSAFNYSFNTKENKIYKGLNSVKYINIKVADVLAALCTKEYHSFTDVLFDCRNINKRQIESLIYIQFFDNFGGIKKLLEVYKVFKDLSDKSNIKKSTEYGQKYAGLISKFAEKETASQYMKVNMKKLINAIEQITSDEPMEITDKLRCYYKATGCVDITGREYRGIGVVLEVYKKYGETLFKTYALKNGRIHSFKLPKGLKHFGDIKELDILRITKTEYRQRYYYQDSRDLYVTEYKIIGNLEE